MFLLGGVRGQRIIVDPQSKRVMVNTAVHTLPVDLRPLREMGAPWLASCVSSVAEARGARGRRGVSVPRP